MNIYFWGASEKIRSEIKKHIDHYMPFGNEKLFYYNYDNPLPSDCDNDNGICYCVPEGEENDMNGIEFAEMMRSNNKNIDIIFISDNYLSAVPLLRRYIRPLGYFLSDEIEESVKILSELNKKRSNPPGKEYNIQMEFISQYNKIYIDYDHVTYFAACNKKIICNTDNNRNFEFYGTVSNLEAKYGKYFIRCHSAYLINKNKIEYINFSKNYIQIKKAKEKIPISRKYKNMLKQQYLENQNIYFV